jgi:purine-binding chemotaxis protein CheW
MGDIRAKAPPEPSQEVLAVLQRRAERLQAKAEEHHEEASFWVALFPVGNDRYAIPLERVRGALPLKTVTPVPLSPPYLIGILRYQGQLVPTLSLAALLGVMGWRKDPSVLLIVEQDDQQLVALDCEEIPTPNALPARAVDEARARASGAIAEVVGPDRHNVRLIDLTTLLPRRGAPRVG